MKPSHIEFIRTSTPGPYGIPLRVSEWGKEEILFDIEIDGITHRFPIKNSDVLNSIMSQEEEGPERLLIEVDPTVMSKLYQKISAVIKSEKNQFIL